MTADGDVLDVLGINKPLAVGVELKLTASLRLLEQAIHWTHFLHYVWVAIPSGGIRQNTGRNLFNSICADYGIGILEVSKDPWGGHIRVIETKHPRFFRKSLVHYFLEKEEGLQAYTDEAPAGGSNRGGYITPYRITMIEVRKFLEKRPEGATVKEIIEWVDTHYRHPRQSLLNALQKWESDWCGVKRVGRELRFFVRDNSLSA